MSIERLRRIEDEAIKLFNNTDEFKRYLSFVSETSSCRWFNSYICYKTMSGLNIEPGRINTKSGWISEGHKIKDNANRIDIMVNQYRTEFVDVESGDAIEVNQLSESELSKALSEDGIIIEKTDVKNLKDVPVYMECDIDEKSKNINKKRLTKDKVADVLNLLNSGSDLIRSNSLHGVNKKNNFSGEGDYNISKEDIMSIKKAINRDLIKIIAIMRKTNNVYILGVRSYEQAMIVGSVCWVIMKYLGIENNSTDSFEFVSDWVKGVEGQEYNEIRKIRCLDQISILSGQIISKLNEVLNINNALDEDTIDRNYALSELIKAAEADYVQSKLKNKR